MGLYGDKLETVQQSIIKTKKTITVLENKLKKGSRYQILTSENVKYFQQLELETRKLSELYKIFIQTCKDMGAGEEETIYNRTARLEDEIPTLRNEIDVIKRSLRNRLIRYEISKIKKGYDIRSIVD